MTSLTANRRDPFEKRQRMGYTSCRYYQLIDARQGFTNCARPLTTSRGKFCCNVIIINEETGAIYVRKRAERDDASSTIKTVRSSGVMNTPKKLIDAGIFRRSQLSTIDNITSALTCVTPWRRQEP